MDEGGTLEDCRIMMQIVATITCEERESHPSLPLNVFCKWRHR